MTRPRVLLLGYYGKGNFGDDVLLTVTHALTRQAIPQADVSLVVDGAQGAYIQTMLPGVTVLSPGRHGHFDAIIHGGGGVFFDFKQYGLAARLYHHLLRAMGFKCYVRAENMLRKLINRPRSFSSRRIGLGIGVGTFTPGSARLRAALPIMADFALLWLRDTESVRNLAPFGRAVPARVVEGSDLAFLSEHWMTPVPERIAAPRPRLGVILRDWPEAQGGLSMSRLQQTLAHLAAQYDLTGFVFDRHADPQLQQALAPYVSVIWRPEKRSIEAFSQHLAAQDVLLTSRAHGAICGACLGVPSVIVAIEPKLSTVAAMLPRASVQVDAQKPEDWAVAIEQARTIVPEAIAADVAANRARSLAAWAVAREVLA